MERYVSLNHRVRDVLHWDYQYENPEYDIISDGGPKDKHWNRHVICLNIQPNKDTPYNHVVRLVICCSFSCQVPSIGLYSYCSKKKLDSLPKKEKEIALSFLEAINNSKYEEEQ